MLAMSRLTGQWIDVTTSHGERISICMIKAWDGQARIGVLAPPEVEINRREVQEQIDRTGRKRVPRNSGLVTPASDEDAA
jgi:sRNA-binding carbon storage regulator CsrA